MLFRVSVIHQCHRFICHHLPLTWTAVRRGEPAQWDRVAKIKHAQQNEDYPNEKKKVSVSKRTNVQQQEHASGIISAIKPYSGMAGIGGISSCASAPLRWPRTRRSALFCARTSCSVCICVKICSCCAINSCVPGLHRIALSARRQDGEWKTRRTAFAGSA